jgi:hypothetical protein
MPLARSRGNIFFVTTNHKDKLHPALIRLGRIDRQVFILPGDEDGFLLDGLRDHAARGLHRELHW